MNQELNQRIDHFISKYHEQEALSGFLKFLIISFSLTFLILSLEYIAHFNSSIRTVLFFAYVIMNVWVLSKEVLKPLGKRIGLLKKLSEENAARIIGSHFGEIDDSLLNTLQLSKQGKKNELLEASISQKMKEIAPFNFKEAISTKELKKYFKVFLPVLGTILLISFIQPALIQDGTKRIVAFNKDFIPPAPFSFVLEQDQWEIEKGSSLRIHIKTEGEKLPAQINLSLGDKSYPCKRLSNNEFVYRFDQLSASLKFKLEAGQYQSKLYKINVHPSPIVKHFKVHVDYPNYTSYPNKSFNNSGNLLIPEGSKLTWEILAEDTDTAKIKFDKQQLAFTEREQTFLFQKIIYKNLKYQIDLLNPFLKKENILDYEISVIKDQFPKITLQSDSSESNVHSGFISDDYGLKNLFFHVEKDGDIIKTDTLELSTEIGQAFVLFFDPSSIVMGKDEEIQFYFEVKDNDGIHGSKSSFSAKQSFKTLGEDELNAKIESSSQEVRASASDALQDLKEVQKAIEQFQQNLNQKKNLSWQDKQELEKILDQQKKIEKQIEQMKNANQEKNEKSDERSQKEQDLLKKQEQLEELFDEIFDEETKKLMEEIEKMMDELNKDKLEDMMKDLDISNEIMEQELDRSLELFKQLEFDLKMEETISDLQKLAEKQKELAKESEKANKEELSDLKEKQDRLNEEFKKIEESLKNLEEKNNALDERREMPQTQEQQDQIKEQQENSSESLENKKNNKARGQQQKAGEKMEQMAEQMQQVMMEQEEQQQQEDMEDLRTLLDNLIELSHQQERLKSRMLKTNRNDPKYPKLKQAQASIRDESVLIEDSLFALSKRIIQLKSIVNKEITEVNRNLASTLKLLSNNRVSKASTNQQLVMTSYNNLALILDDVLQQMQQQMQMSQQSCSKPGNNKKPSMSKSQMQKQLNQQMKQIQEQMQKKQGMQKGKKQGQKPGGGFSAQGSQQIARMAAQQSAIRKELQKLQKQLEQQKAGKEAQDNVQKALEDMEKQEKDLYNKNFNSEFFKRQEKILSRLLEAENAEREQEWDNKRQSKEGKNKENGNPDQFEEYKRLKKKEAEQLRTVPPNLKPYYKKKISDFNKLKD